MIDESTHANKTYAEGTTVDQSNNMPRIEILQSRENYSNDLFSAKSSQYSSMSTNFKVDMDANSKEDENESLLVVKPRSTLASPDSSKNVFSDDYSFFGILRKNVRYGIPSAFSIGDYFMCSMLLKFLVAATEDHELAAATAYYTAFFSCLMQAMNLGIIETQGIFGSQAFGNKDFQYLQLILRQAMMTSVVMFTLFTVPPSFFIE